MGNRLKDRATTLLTELARGGIRLKVRNDRLAFFPASRVTADLRRRLRSCKAELVDLLSRESESEGLESRANNTAGLSGLNGQRAAPDASVSVIIPVEGEARHLESAVVSALGQMQLPGEILIVDATGEATAPDFAELRLLRVESPEECLPAGVRASRGKYLLFLNPDNLLRRDYIEQALAAFDDRSVGAVYSDHQLFGGAAGRTTYPDEVDRDDLARSGIAHLPAVIRREALVSLDVWDRRTLLPSLARSQWRLRKQSSTLLVRGSQEARTSSYFERLGLAEEEITLFIPLSGREHTWEELSQFLERQTWPRHLIRLILCDTSGQPEFSRLVKEWTAGCDYGDVRHFRYSPARSGLADEPRNGSLQRVNEAMCRIYNRLRPALETAYCWILEDDIVPPDDVLERLLRQFEEDVACVSAPYRSRFDGQFLVWDGEAPDGRGVRQIGRPPFEEPQVREVRGTGFGCLVVRSECLKRHVFSLPRGERLYDAWFFKSLGENWRRRVDWACECRHLHNAPRPGTEINRRNLIYHITPFAGNDVWRRNVRQLLKRIRLFNGRRVVAIATGEGLVDPDEVMEAFAGEKIEFLVRPNSRRLRENATFLPLLESVESDDPSEATFYGHAKGVSTVGDARGVTYWRNAMYHELLDDWPKVAELLSDHAVVGTHRWRHDENPAIFPDGRSRATWHFAGTFFWLRNRDVFSSGRWRDEWQPTGWGVEAWPGSLFPFDRSACVAFDQPTNPYDPLCYPHPIPDEEEIMTEANEQPAQSEALKIELGGGENPRGDGYVNLDKRNLATVDHVCDFETDDLPFEDDSVRAVYSSHTFEHIDYGLVLREIARVCEIGAYVEIKVPHWLSENALIQGHRHTFGPEEVERMTETAIGCYWSGCSKRLKCTGTEYVPSRHFEEAKSLFPHFSDEQVLRYVPNACFETRYTFHVIENA